MARRLSRSEARALEHIRFTPGITRHELAADLGVSVTTVNPIVSRLIDERLVSEVLPGKGERTGAGRPRAGLRASGEAKTVVAVLWSHGVLDRAVATFDNQIVWRRRTPVAGHPAADQLEAAAREALDAARAAGPYAPPERVVLALPAPYEAGVGVGRGASVAASGAFASWFADDPQVLLSTELGIPVIVENDANLGALGEAAAGAARDEPAAIFVKLSGHGIGAGLTINGTLFPGAHGFAGEIAHLRVDDDSRVICACGSRGCLEERIGPNMLRQLHANYGPEITFEDLLSMVELGTPGPTRLLQDAGRVAGRALADICTFFNPSVLVLDAGSAAATRVLILGVREQIEQSTPPFSRRELRIVPGDLKEKAAIYGAVRIARDAAVA